jgi:hypothetical protein
MARQIHCTDIVLNRPVTCGLHVPSLFRRETQLHVHRVFRSCDLPVIHGYAMFHPELARHPLDPLFVPFLCALTSALCLASASDDIDNTTLEDECAGADASRWAVLAEEFGACTQPDPTSPSDTWVFPTFAGVERRQFMAAQHDYAKHLSVVLPALRRVGASGAVLWCWADYARELHDQPPCNLQRHERHFGLVDADGALKPHAHVLRQFATESLDRLRPETWAARVVLPCSAREFYLMEDADRLVLLRSLFGTFCAAMESGDAAASDR